MIENAKKTCAELGVKMTLSVDINPARLETLWYGGTIVTLEYNGKIGKIAAVGDVCFNIRNENNTGYTCMYRNTSNTGVSEGSWLFDHIASDEEFENNIAVGLLEWLNNNWIDFSIYDGSTCIYHEPYEDASNLREVFQDIEYYVKKIKDLA